MRRFTIAIVVAAATAASQSKRAQAERDIRGNLTDETLPARFALRDAAAPGAVKLRLDVMRGALRRQNASFSVAFTTAVEHNARARAVVRPPAHLAQLNSTAVADDVTSATASNSSTHGSRNVRGPARQLAGAVVDACASGSSLILPTTPVKDQGWRCGSCWAFAAVGAYEDAAMSRGYGEQDLSEQQVLTCSGYGTCDGGWFADVWSWQERTGIVDESTLPYTGKDGPCLSTASGPWLVDSWQYVDNTVAIPSVASIKAALCARGTLATALWAGPYFEAYSGGVFDRDEAPYYGAVSHAVTLIGWDDSKRAWLLKNTWGSSGWGLNGFMWIRYGVSSVGYGAAWVTPRLPTPTPAVVAPSAGDSGSPQSTLPGADVSPSPTPDASAAPTPSSGLGAVFGCCSRRRQAA